MCLSLIRRFLEDGKYVTALKDKEGALCCIVELTEDNR